MVDIHTHTRCVRLLFGLLRERDQVPEQKPVSGVQPGGLSADVNRYICLFLCVKRQMFNENGINSNTPSYTSNMTRGCCKW